MFSDTGESAVSQVPLVGAILAVTLTSNKYCVTNQITTAASQKERIE